MDRDGLPRPVTLTEVVALQHPRDRVPGGKLDQIRRVQIGHPAGIEQHQSLGRIENLENLRLVALRVLDYFVPGQRRAGGALAGGIADHPGEITDQEQHLVAQILKLPQLVDQHRMPKVQIGGRRVEARLDSQRLAPGELFLEFGLDENFGRAAPDQAQRILY